MKIYRVEDADCEGMYRRADEKENTLINDEQCGRYNHPTPTRDLQLKYSCGDRVDLNDLPTDYLFGFNSIEQAKAWITEDRWIRDLHTRGFHLVEIEIPSRYVYIGDTQLIFLNPKVESRIKHNISEALCGNNES